MKKPRQPIKNCRCRYSELHAALRALVATQDAVKIGVLVEFIIEKDAEAAICAIGDIVGTW